jgi:uncharacterized membrane protein YgcG
MQKKKKIASQTCSILLAGTMLMSAMPYAALATDISGHWAEKQLQQFIDEGYLKGDGTGNYLPNQTISRAEFAAMVNRYFGYTTQSSDISKYTDVASGAWYHADLAKALAAGYMSGTTASTMAPTTPVTREQAFTMLARALKLADGDASTLSAFTDGAQTASYAKGPAAALVAKKIISGNEANQLMPTKIMTRAEAVTMLSRITKDSNGSNNNGNNNNNNNNGNTSGGSSGGSSGGGGGHHSGGSSTKVTTWAELYKGLGVDTTTGYDAVTSATNFSGYHVKDIPTIVNKDGTSLTGVKVTNKAATVKTKLSSASYAYSSNYGTGEFDIIPDDTVDGYVWNDYKNNLYAVTISDGTTTVGALPWIDYYGEDATSGYHYNKVQIALNNGTSKATNQADVQRYKAFYDESGKHLKPGTYTVTLYSDGYEPLKAEIEVKADSDVTASVTAADFSAKETTVIFSDKNDASAAKTLPEDYNAEYTILCDGKPAEGFSYDASTGKITWQNAEVKAGNYQIQIDDQSGKYASITATITLNVYALMNIPYNDFYKAELSNNTVAVDAVSSATKNKTRTGSLVSGSYHVNADGTDITGVTYPVKIATSALSGKTQIKDADSIDITVTMRGQPSTTTYTGKAALFQANSYAYYLLSETPAQYKIATSGRRGLSFGSVQGSNATATEATATLSAQSNYGDYQISVNDLDLADDTVVYGVKLSALDEDGKTTSYGLRHLENIWRKTKLAFSTGFVTETHGNTLSSAHYASIMGKTIQKITYYTSAGVYEIATNLKVPVKSTEATATVTDATYSVGETTAQVHLPSDFDPEYSITVNGKTSNFFRYDAETKKITWNATQKAPAGAYQLVIHDKNGKYADITAAINLNVYAYAAVPYDEYWKSEGVYLSGSDWTASSDVADRTTTNKDGSVTAEHDKGAFDAVSRATTNHGLHCGSFQQAVVIHGTKDGEAHDYHPISWNDSNNFVDQDGKTYNKAEIGITSYNITGIKYVPVKVKASDFTDFKTHYTVVENGGILSGGYTEKNLTAYNDLVAAVDANTNGLKEVTKGRSGYSFGARQTGTGSGIQGVALKTADSNIKAEAKPYSGSFGEMLRVDLDNTTDDTKYYGDLGSHMQTVVWKYYGSGDEVLATYGTKFAADDWMHKSMGIQLGLTDSLRCQLPADTDGTGKWTVTVYALGYSDTIYTVNVTSDNLPQPATAMTEEQKTKLTALVNQAAELLANYDATTASDAEKLLKQRYDEASALLSNAEATSDAATELLGELPDMIATVKAEHAQQATKTVNGSAPVTGYGYDALVSVTYDPSTGKITEVTDNNTTPDDNSSFWNSAKAMFAKFVGLDKDGVSAMKTDPKGTKTDAVTGATYSSDAIRNAVLNSQD